MEISASLVRELREKTGVGMMDCKKALTETQGDFEAAVKYLREKGLATASKKADRETSEGRIFTAVSGKNGVILELNCETDFVAGNETFIALGTTIANAVLAGGQTTVDQLSGLSVDGKDLQAVLSEAVLKLGENIGVKRFERFESQGALGHYVHSNGKIGVLVDFDQAVAEDLGKDVAMQVAASNPMVVQASQVPAEELEKEKEIIRNKAVNEGKNPNFLDKVIEGRLQKFYKEICLVEQEFIKDPSKSVKEVLGAAAVVRFSRYSLV
ncbi:MAG: translation elongation factor Ts [Candidatus Margulisiibacteriota bacterium]